MLWEPRISPIRQNTTRSDGFYNEKGDADHTLFANGEQELSSEELMRMVTEA